MKTTWRTELPQLLLLVGMFLLAALTWSTAPDRIAVHWNFSGEVDRYGGKFEGLLAIPLVALAVYLLLLFLPRIDPGRANYASFARAYTVIRFAVLGLISAVYGMMLLWMRDHRFDVAVVAPLLVGVLMILLGNFMGKIRPNWFVGIRTPWTLSSKLSWSRTHRAGGWVFIAAGLAILLTGFLRSTRWFALLIGLIMAGVLGLTIYSYVVWRGDPDKVPPTGTFPVDSPEE